MKINNRMENIEEYHFKKIEDMKKKLILQGRKIFDFSIGDPDIAVDDRITKKLIDSLENKYFNRYPPYNGIKELKDSVKKYYDMLGIKLEDDEILILIGSKEGIFNTIPAVCSFNDYALIPNPSYPVYETSCRLWGVIPYKVPLKENMNYMADLRYIPDEIVRKSKIFIVNYPNNPTGAAADEDFYKEIVDFCYNNNIVLCNDGAYNDIIPEDKETLSILKYGKGKNCVEFGSLSKTFSMPGFRVGYVAGNREIINNIAKVKSNADSGQFIPIQMAAVEAFNIYDDCVKNVRHTYDMRRKCAYDLLEKSKIRFFKGNSTFYVWCNVPLKYTTDEFCSILLNKYNIIVTPGYVFGNLGYGYFRISLTQSEKIIKEAFKKLTFC